MDIDGIPVEPTCRNPKCERVITRRNIGSWSLKGASAEYPNGRYAAQCKTCWRRVLQNASSVSTLNLKGR